MPTIKDGDMTPSSDWDSVTDTAGNGTIGATSSPEGGSGYSGAGCFEAKQTCSTDEYGECSGCANHPYREYVKTFPDELNSLIIRVKFAGKGGGCYCAHGIVSFSVYDGSDTLIGGGTIVGSEGTEKAWANYEHEVTSSDIYPGYSFSDIRKIIIKCGLTHVVC